VKYIYCIFIFSLILSPIKAQYINIEPNVYKNLPIKSIEVPADISAFNIKDILNSLQTKISTSQNNTVEKECVDLLKAYNFYLSKDYYEALKFCVKNEKSFFNSDLLIKNYILKSLVYQKLESNNNAIAVLNNFKTANKLLDFQIQAQINFLSLKQSSFSESYIRNKASLSQSKTISNYDYYTNLYNLSKLCEELNLNNEFLIYSKRADSTIRKEATVFFNPELTYNNIGDNPSKYINYLRKQSLLNLSIALRKNKQYKNSIETIEELQKLSEKEGDNSNLAYVYTNKGLTNTYIKDYNAAEYNYLAALKLYTSNSEEEKIAETYNLLARNSFLNQDFGKAVNRCNKSIEISKNNSDFKELAASYFILSETYALNSDYVNSQKYFKLYNEVKQILIQQKQKESEHQRARNSEVLVLSEKAESDIVKMEKQELELANAKIIAAQKENELLLLKKENEIREKDLLNQTLEKEKVQRSLILLKEQIENEQLQVKYEAMSNERAIKFLESKNKEKEIRLLNVEKSNYFKENQLKSIEITSAKKSQRIYLFASLFFLIFTLSLFYFLRKNQNQKKVIEKYSKNIENSNSLLNDKMLQITEQKELIEAKNLLIMDSIEYAKTIQNSFLFSEEKLKLIFNDAFVIFHPKDTVSGDFYLVKEYNDKIYVSAADCTGHGVPGAMISALAYQELNHIIEKFNGNDLSEILTSLNASINSKLNSGTSIGSNGMDLVLLCIDPNLKTIDYCGAKGFFIMCNDTELIEYKTDKISIGQILDDTQSFSVNTISYKSAQSLYLFTDGLIDQFSFLTKKRVGSKQFKLELEEIRKKQFTEQKMEIDSFVSKNIGTGSQTDDITIIGIKL